MAIFQNKIFLVLLCLIGVFAGTPALAGSNTAPSGEPFPKPSENMEGCAAKLTVPCGLEVFLSFSGNNNNPSDDCCKKLVATGIDCHNAFTEILISKEPQENPSKISLRSMDIWNRCVAMAIFQNKIFLVLLCLIGVFAGTPALAGSNTAPSGEPFPKPSKNMEGCAAKLTVPGNNNNPSDDCCKKLVATGIDCHNAFTEILISKEPQENPSKISLRSMDIWNRCVAVASKA
uniref:Prolamin-like domain-containing protein n=1 Tax=Salix viminalis TaxID=40686 RepID=A0A6N2N433_SALVM